jgi:hypothetical protein
LKPAAPHLETGLLVAPAAALPRVAAASLVPPVAVRDRARPLVCLVALLEVASELRLLPRLLLGLLLGLLLRCMLLGLRMLLLGLRLGLLMHEVLVLKVLLLRRVLLHQRRVRLAALPRRRRRRRCQCASRARAGRRSACHKSGKRLGRHAARDRPCKRPPRRAGDGRWAARRRCRHGHGRSLRPAPDDAAAWLAHAARRKGRAVCREPTPRARPQRHAWVALAAWALWAGMASRRGVA